MSSGQAERVLSDWRQLQRKLDDENGVSLGGHSLTIPDLVAIARHRKHAHIGDLPIETIFRIEESIEILNESLHHGYAIYGVNTGFGGSANMSTSSTKDLQVALLQMQLCAVLPPLGPGVNGQSLPSSGPAANLCMPETWVRGAILARCNSLLRGHSAVRLDIIKMLLKFLEHDLIPVVPLRGSISASGDLCPLSYIAGFLEGNSDVHVWSGSHPARIPIPADQALKSIGLAPVSFGPKEILGLLNGTAFSLSATAIAHHQAETLAILAQVLTAMGTEALLGTVDNFHPFIAEVRPHPGQVEVARNIRGFLQNSKLAHSEDQPRTHNGKLAQDRYALRTSSQWLGPTIEDLQLSHSQIEIELNSTTDNPLISTSPPRIHNGGNFQALSLTSSTEKTRLSLERIGKLLFAQSTELLSSHLNNSLPPNLAVDEPSLSYTTKGLDINMAAYMSELSYVANPVGTHVLSAEMSNQGVNSLALISARATHTAVELVGLMCSTYLYCLCQAMDLRVMNAKFLDKLEPEVKKLTGEILRDLNLPADELDALHQSMWQKVVTKLETTTHLDSSSRFQKVANSAQHILISAFQTHTLTHPSSSPKINYLTLATTYTTSLATLLKSTFLQNRTQYLENPDATKYLGNASKRMYNFVRKELWIPMHRGLVDHPTRGGENVIGTYVGRIYDAVKGNGEEIMRVLGGCLEDIGVEEMATGGVRCNL